MIKYIRELLEKSKWEDRTWVQDYKRSLRHLDVVMVGTPRASKEYVPWAVNI